MRIIFDELIDPAEAARALRISIATLWRQEKKGILPKPIRFSKRCVKWRKIDILRFIGIEPEAENPRSVLLTQKELCEHYNISLTRFYRLKAHYGDEFPKPVMRSEKGRGRAILYNVDDFKEYLEPKTITITRQ